MLTGINAYLATPTETLMNRKGHSALASGLKMITPHCKDGDFFRSSVPIDIVKAVRMKLQADFNDLSHVHNARIFAAMSEVLNCQQRLKDQHITNKAEARYAMCTPIMSMVCDIYQYKIKLEESVKQNLELGDEDDVDSFNKEYC